MKDRILHDIRLWSAVLENMRCDRDRREPGEVRSAFNAACDRLAVLVSKLREEYEAKKRQD